MHATAPEFEPETIEQEPGVSWAKARQEDAYWQRAFWQERYYSARFDYEDYAPAYCVGYAGCAQYGGDFADAEASLCANWERIKGDSRLCLQEAMPAIRAAWNRMARERARRLQLTFVEDEAVTRPRRCELAMHLNTAGPAATGAAAAAP
jgi:hypothetical protein